MTKLQKIAYKYNQSQFSAAYRLLSFRAVMIESENIEIYFLRPESMVCIIRFTKKYFCKALKFFMVHG